MTVVMPHSAKSRIPAGRIVACLLAALWLLLLPDLTFADESRLDLSNRSFGALGELTAILSAAGSVDTVDLTGVTLDADERRALLAAYPTVRFIWKMTVWGVQVTSEDEAITFDSKKAGDIAALCDTLDCMPNVKKVYMWNMQLTREVRDKLFFGYPNVFFGWDIRLNAAHHIRTDATAFSTLSKKPGLYSYNMWNFVYCPNLLALDVGHNTIKNLDFLTSCNKLKILIAIGARITDLTPIACQTDLEYLELFMNEITDISPLANLVNLRDVNLAFNDIADLSPLYELPHLERVWLMMNKRITDDEIARLRAHQPNCEIVTRSYGSTGNVMLEDGTQIPGTSWRHHPHYNTIYYIFNGGGYVDWDADVPSRYE